MFISYFKTCFCSHLFICLSHQIAHVSPERLLLMKIFSKPLHCYLLKFKAFDHKQTLCLMSHNFEMEKLEHNFLQGFTFHI